MSTALQKKPAEQIATVKDLLTRASASFAQVLPKHLTAERMVKIATAAITRQPLLLECTPQSLLQSVMQAAELGLEPGSALGEGYLVPFKNKSGTRLAQFIPGYRGLIALARRSGQIEDIEAHVVYQGDRFVYRKGTNAVLEHEPKLEGEPGPLMVVYAMGWLRGSTRPHVEVLRKSDIEKIRKRSRAGSDGPWVTDYDEMARKTAVRRLVKYLPMSVEMAKAFQAEDDAELDDDVIDATTGEVLTPPSGFKKRVSAAARKAAGPVPMENFVGEAIDATEAAELEQAEKAAEREPGAEG